MYGSVRVGKNNPKGEWWNDEAKAAVQKNDAVLKGILGAGSEIVKDVWNLIGKKSEELLCLYHSKKKGHMSSLEGRWIRM